MPLDALNIAFTVGSKPPNEPDVSVASIVPEMESSRSCAASIARVKRRHVFHIPGYDAIGASWYRLFRRELQIFSSTWHVATAVSELTPGATNGNSAWTVTTRGLNWSVETSYEPLLWDDIVRGDDVRPMGRRLLLSFQVFLNVIGSGAFFRYCSANWQYALFFLFPYAATGLFALVAIVIAERGIDVTGLSGPLGSILTGLIAVGIFLVLMHWLGRKWGVSQALDDWIFSWGYLSTRRADIDQRIDQFSERLVERARDETLDEILIVGHSMGATLALEVLTRALAHDHNFARQRAPVCLLTVGSTIPKFTLHPAGERFRRYAEQIVKEPSISWAEYHARSDLISFYKFDPVRLTRFYGDPRCGKPILRRIKMHQMLKRSTYWSYRLRFMRLHYQFVMANECRATYDYFMMACGPIPFSRMVLTAGGAAELIASDSSLIAPHAPEPVMPEQLQASDSPLAAS